jgi:hypothetical protein
MVLKAAHIHCTAAGNRLRVEPGDSMGPAEINSLLVHSGVQVSQLVTEHRTLEATFFELTERS